VSDVSRQPAVNLNDPLFRTLRQAARHFFQPVFIPRPESAQTIAEDAE